MSKSSKYDIPPIPKRVTEYREQMWFITHTLKHSVAELNGSVQQHEKQLIKLETESAAIKILGGLLIGITTIWVAIKKIFI